MDRNSSLFNLIFCPFFSACGLTVPIVANTGKLFNCTKLLQNSVAEFDSTKSCPNTGTADNKFVITVALIL